MPRRRLSTLNACGPRRLLSRTRSFRGFASKVALCCGAGATVNLVLGDVTVAAVGRGGRQTLLPGVDAVGRLQGQSILTATGPALAVGLLLALVAFWRIGARRRLLWPVSLVLAAGAAALVDVADDGHVTRWIDPPVLPPVNLSDLALIVAALVIVYRIGEALGGDPVIDPGSPLPTDSGSS